MSEARIRASESYVQRLGLHLSERDWEIVRFLAQHRFATSVQLRRCFFSQHATASASARASIRVLDRLMMLRIVSRLERTVGGSSHGSAAFVWCLDVVGDRLTRPSGSARLRSREPSLTFLSHTLAVTEARTELVEAARTGAFDLTRVEIETEAWRRFVSSGGGQSVLQPDLFVTTSDADYDDHWYIEIDLGTESLPVLLRKCLAYDQYRRTGRAQAEHGVFPRVLWVVPTAARTALLKAAVAAAPTLSDRLFVVTEPEQFVSVIRSPDVATAIDEPGKQQTEGGQS
jgi:hypothetical protein